MQSMSFGHEAHIQTTLGQAESRHTSKFPSTSPLRLGRSYEQCMDGRAAVSLQCECSALYRSSIRKQIGIPNPHAVVCFPGSNSHGEGHASHYWKARIDSRARRCGSRLAVCGARAAAANADGRVSWPKHMVIGK